MKKIIISAIAAATLLTSVNAIANLKKSSKAMKVSNTGEAMYKKEKTSIIANQNIAKSKNNKHNKLAKK